MAKPNRPRTTKPDAGARRPPAQARALPPRLDDEPVPKDIDEFRVALARRMLTFLGMPRRCREPICRRTKRCAGPDLRCQRDNPAPPRTPEQHAHMMAAMLRTVRRRLAEEQKP